MTYYALTVPGVEGLLAREIADGGGHVSERRSGVARLHLQEFAVPTAVHVSQTTLKDICSTQL